FHVTGVQTCALPIFGLSAPKRMKGFEAHLHQWGELDIEAVLQYALHQLPTDTLLYASHSVGGQVFGLAESNKHVQKVLMVASQRSEERRVGKVRRTR